MARHFEKGKVEDGTDWPMGAADLENGNCSRQDDGSCSCISTEDKKRSRCEGRKEEK
jgi:hypothetical protein